MNIQAYIESGILEEYVLGTVSPQEKQEVECMSHIYPEIKEELLRTESALEEYALKHQTAPPPSLKESLFARMNFDTVQETDEVPAEAQANDLPANTAALAASPQVTAGDPRGTSPDADRIELREVTPLWARLAAAAAIILAVFAGWSAFLLSQASSDNERLIADMAGMKTQMAEVQSSLAYSESLADMYRNPDYKVVKMAGMPKSPESSAAAFWNQKTNEVMIDVQNLPAAPLGKQYQLWSIVDGKPVDIGMLDHQFAGKLLKMKNTQSGSVAFAITLEKEGGVPSPTMEEMYVMGKVS
jgi:anti-sigma-K factor RskA